MTFSYPLFEMTDECKFHNFLIWGTVGSTVCCLGFVGNILSLVAFRRGQQLSATILLQCLATSDLMLLASVFSTDALPYTCEYSGTCSNPWHTWPYIRYFWILTPVSHMCSIWFVVLIALNRFWAVCKPYSMSHIWNPRKVKIYILSLISIIISFNIPRLFEYRITDGQIYNTSATSIMEESTYLGQSWSYRIVYKVTLVSIMSILLPIVTLIILTSFILNTMRNNRNRRTSRQNLPLSDLKLNDTTSSGSTAAPRRRSLRSGSEITFMLLTVVIVTILCQTPLAAFHFLRYTTDYDCGNIVFYLDNISKLFVNINSCVNFVIYCLLSPKFRAMLVLSVKCKKLKHHVVRNSRDNRPSINILF